jgi:hypothetical protein
MSPLFDNEDWSRSGGPDVQLPSFLRDDLTDIPGPSDVSLTYQGRGPNHQLVAQTTWSAQPQWPAEPSYATSYATEPSYAPHPSYGTPSSYAAKQSYGSDFDSPQVYPDPAGGPAASAWDPLFDPWPPPADSPGSFDSAGSEQGWPLPWQPGRAELPPEHPSGPLPRTPAAPEYNPFGEPSHFDVTLNGDLGYADLGFAHGRWFSLGGIEPRMISARDALRSHPRLGGAIVQVMCLWMRENPNDPRALDMATELAFAVGEIAREAARLTR